MMVYLAGTSTLEINLDKCTGCGVCLEVCPREVFELHNRKAVITELDLCIECGACQRNCRYEALSVQVGVGCASALINSIRSGGEPICGCERTQPGAPGGARGSSCC